MPTNIVITAGSIRLEAELNDTFTAKAISNILPITAAANTWGDEIYFSMPITLELENGQEVVDLGDLGYWPPGGAFCIFYGIAQLWKILVVINTDNKGPLVCIDVRWYNIGTP